MSIDRTTKIAARFFVSATGKMPARDWILEFDPDDRRVLGKDIQKVEFGWPIGMPYCRPLGQGLWEVRSDISAGRIARTLFCIIEGDMVLLHGFVKKTQKTPPKEIEIALRRKKELE
jgi:phage-related protein